ncbi:MAG TPA: sigma-70 family RNA polymerase sigma factor [Verrucomicrobiae bacterium]|nr:sigma-70 family RNA polymerase sigma factor [Verrucomicrobiae bacterium]
MTSDLDLLRRFARDNAQDAFAEIVRRHLNLVYSAALRQVRSPQLAEDIAQSVFADLARVAMTPSSPLRGRDASSSQTLTPWLYAVTRRTAIDVLRKESRRQLREQIAVEMNNMNANSGTGVPPVWSDIEPLLDDAMAALDETDRSAVLLRYFENKSLREVGEALGASEDAAQKRVSRAVERLREFFSKQKITIGASGLAILISANAVQSAPVGLAAAILTGTTTATSTAIAATKTIAMTTFQKTIFAAIVTAAVGIGIYILGQISRSQIEPSPRVLAGQPNINPPATPQAERVNSRVFVGGEVDVPGPKVWTQGMKLTDGIRMAEMMTDNADKQAIVRSSSGTTNVYDLVAILNGSKEDPLLKPDDVVIIPRAETIPNPDNEIHVSGAVVLPSHWTWTNGMKLTDAIKLVGGLAEFADGRIQITHRYSTTNEQFNVRDIQSGRADDPMLKPGDGIQALPPHAPKH